jgi:hypothetical protein
LHLRSLYEKASTFDFTTGEEAFEIDFNQFMDGSDISYRNKPAGGGAAGHQRFLEFSAGADQGVKFKFGLE